MDFTNIRTFKVWTEQACVPKMTDARKKDLHGRVVDVLASIPTVEILAESSEYVEFTTIKQ